MIDPDRLKAFLDDLALLSVRHGLYLSGSWMRLLELDDRFGGYEPSPGQTTSGVSCQPVQIYVYEAGTTPIGEVYSIDVSRLTAHERIRLKRKGWL